MVCFAAFKSVYLMFSTLGTWWREDQQRFTQLLGMSQMLPRQRLIRGTNTHFSHLYPEKTIYVDPHINKDTLLFQPHSPSFPIFSTPVLQRWRKWRIRGLHLLATVQTCVPGRHWCRRRGETRETKQTRTPTHSTATFSKTATAASAEPQASKCTGTQT